MINNALHKNEWQIKSQPRLVPPLIKGILKALEGCIFITQEERDDIKLILNELIYNAVIHGNDEDASKRVYVSLSVNNRFVSGCITDEGRGFNTKDASEEFAPDDMHDETGRGMKLATALADELYYSEGGKQVVFVKKVGRHNG